MLDDLKNFYNEQIITTESILGPSSHRLISVLIWTKEKEVVGINEVENFDNVQFVCVINQETDKRMIFNVKNLKKIKIFKKQIKAFLTNGQMLSLKY